MHLSQISLTHFRGASQLSLSLHPRLNVFYGINGAGKSTVLDASAILLSWLVGRIKSKNGSGRPLLETDIRNDTPGAQIELECIHQQLPLQWRLAKTRKGYLAGEHRSSLKQLSELATGFQKQITEQEGRADLPLMAYYPVNRAVLDIPLRIRARHTFDLLSAFEESLTGGANFRTFFEWFREREDLENEQFKYNSDLYPDPQLETVRRALNQFMPNMEKVSVRRNPLRMEVIKNGRPLTVNQLSDGERCLMAMIGDLARRLAIANPNSDPLLGEGIILIDEIDLHLHPTWQKIMVPKLQAVFPRCQFLISTHSPHIINHVKPESLFLLQLKPDGIEADHPSESYGKNIDRVLEDLMGASIRPEEVTNNLKTVYDLIEQGRYESAKEQIDVLQCQIGLDPELVKASVLITRKELIGR